MSGAAPHEMSSEVNNNASFASRKSEAESEVDPNPSLKKMGTRFVSLAVPTMASNIMWFSIAATTQMFVGCELGPTALAQFSIGISVFNALGLATGTGFCAALDTLVSQAFGRDTRSSDMSRLMHRGIAFNFIMWAIISLIFLFSKPLLATVFDEVLTEGAYEYLRASPAMLMAILHVQAIMKSMQAINLPHLPMFMNLVGCLVNPLYCFFLVKHGITAAVIACTLSFWTMLVFGIVILKSHKGASLLLKAEFSVSDAMQPAGAKEYVSIALPAMLSLCAEWWSFEVLQVITAQVSVEAVAVFSVIMSIVVFAFSSPLGIGIATSVTVGNSLGANLPVLAKRYGKFAFGVDQVATFFTASAIFLFSGHIARLYTTDESIISQVAAISWLCAFLHWGDSTQFTLQGIFRGAGQQAPGAKIVLVSLWLVGIPSALVFSLKFDWGLNGVLSGLVLGILLEVPLLFRHITTWDWNTIALKAAKDEAEQHHHTYDDVVVMTSAAVVISDPVLLFDRFEAMSREDDRHLEVAEPLPG